MKTRRDKLDTLFSLLVRERAEWMCEVCGRYFPEDARQGLHCSHHFSRRKRSIRLSPLNASAHCFSCHQTLGENPVLFHDWIKGHLGDEKFAALRIQAERLVRLKKHDRADIYSNLKASWEDMQARRKSGEMGRIEFEDPMPDDVWASTKARAA